MEPLYRLSVLRRVLQTCEIRPTKSLGQNFLVDRNTLDRIVNAAAIEVGERVLEIGPGVGTLTQALLGRGARVLAVEKDGRLAQVLRTLFAGESNLEIVHADALTFDLSSLRQAEGGGVKAVSNLPYYVTTPLLMRLLQAAPPFSRIVLLLQKEVGERMLAAPGTKAYGALSVAVAFRADAFSAGTVPPSVFYPTPSVSSQIVVLTPRPSPHPYGSEAVFSQVVRSAFSKRRKTLHNALKELPFPAEEIARAFVSAGIDPSRRGETLSLAEFSQLSAAISPSARCDIM